MVPRLTGCLMPPVSNATPPAKATHLGFGCYDNMIVSGGADTDTDGTGIGTGTSTAEWTRHQSERGSSVNVTAK